MEIIIICVVIMVAIAGIAKLASEPTKTSMSIKLSQPIDLRYKYIKGFWGKQKIVSTTTGEQRRLKQEILKIFPDNHFYDNLNEENSITIENKGHIKYTCSIPIDLRYKYKRNLFGKRKKTETRVGEQKKIKKAFLKIFPSSMFYDDLYDRNSMKTSQARCNTPAWEDAANDYAENILENGSSRNHYNADHCDCDVHNNHNDCEGSDACNCDCDD